MSLTIYDISKMAGVSIATVSRVLNGSDSVKPATRKKVMDVIEKHDYKPNAFARGMGLGQSKTVGILCADSSDTFLAKAVYLLEQELQANGYESLLCCTGYNLDSKKNYINLILSKKVDSIILVGSNFIADTEQENSYIEEASLQVPVMLLNAALDHPNVYSTLCDDYAAVAETVRLMYDSGVKNMVFIYDAKSYSGKKKRDGFKATCRELSIDNYEKRIFLYEGKNDSANDIADFIQSIKYSGVDFDGIICATDNLAVGALKYAKRNNLAVPDELSIMGYNDSFLATCCTPELSSVDNRMETLTSQLVTTMMGIFAGQEMPAKAIFTGKVISRETTRF